MNLLENNKILYALLALAVLLLAAALRIHGLNTQGLWGDEGWSVEFSEPEAPEDVMHNLVDDLHPPLYFIMLSLWRQIAGDSEIALRLTGVLPAILTVALVIRLGTDLFSRPAGLAAGLVLALADKHVVLAQEVRHYPLAFMLMALSSLLFLRWLQRPTRLYSLLYTTTIIISVYTHYYTALILLVQILYALAVLRPWGRFWRLSGMMALAGMAFLPWSLIAYHQLDIRPEGILHSMPLNTDTFEFLLIDYLGRPEILVGGLTLLGIVTLRKSNDNWFLEWRDIPGVWYVTLWLLLPILVTVGLFEYVTLLTDRNLALLLVPIALLAGHGLSGFRLPGRVVLVALLVGNGLASLDSYDDHPPWRELATYVADHYPEGEPVLMDVRGGDKALRYHLEQQLPEDTQVISLNQWRIDFGPYFLGVVAQLLEENQGFWVAYWGEPDYEMEPFFEIYNYVRTATHTEYHQGFPIDLYHFDRVPAEPDIRFGESIGLHQARFAQTASPGGSIEVTLWWSTSQPLQTSYSVSVFLLNEVGLGVRGAQHDGSPRNGQSPTTTWQADEIVLDVHKLPIPAGIEPGNYRLATKVYNSLDGTVLPVQNADGNNMGEYHVLGVLRVE
jgi:hypothetical protein